MLIITKLFSLVCPSVAQSVTNQNVEPDDNCSNSEDNKKDAMEIDSKSAVNSGEALAMLDKLQVFLEENDAENNVL